MIKHLKTNLKSEIPITVELPRLLVLVGRTGAGKSTIPDAIEFALSGEVGNVYGKRELTKDTQLLISMAPSTEPDRLFVDVKTDSGLKIHREVTRLDGSIKRLLPFVSMEAQNNLDKSLPLRRVTDAMSSGAATRQRFIWDLVESYLTDEDRQELSALNLPKTEDGRLDLSTLTGQLDVLAIRLKQARDGLKAAEESAEESAQILHARREALSAAPLVDDSLRDELAQIRARLDADEAVHTRMLALRRKLGQALDQERRQGPTACPTCSRPWSLPAATDEAGVDSIEAELAAEIESIDETVMLNVTERDDLNKRRRELHNIVAHRENLEGAIKSFDQQFADAVTAKVRFGGEIQSLQQSIKQLKAAMSEGIARAARRLTTAIQRYLPAGWSVALYQDGGRGNMSFGLVVDGHFRPTLSGGQTAILHTAIAMCLPVVHPMTFIAVPDADIDDETMSEMMESFAHWSGQVIITQTKEPSRSVPEWEVRRVK